ncbi:MAG: methyltransferase domain-containing protein [Candidatus Nanopelagicales bacterium]|jgi:ubiquinone/menaquinone biosynthesis C-methylase UbiE
MSLRLNQFYTQRRASAEIASYGGFHNVGWWDDGVTDQMAASATLVQRLVTAVPHASDRVLDLCAGPGGTTRLLRQVLPSATIVAVDLFPPDGQVAVRADAAALPFRSNCFDAILCVEAAMHVDSRRVLLIECARTLKPGGGLAMSDVLVESERGWSSLIPASNRWTTPAEVHDELAALGFVDIAVQDVTARTWEPFWDHLEATSHSGTLAQIRDRRREFAIDAYITVTATWQPPRRGLRVSFAELTSSDRGPTLTADLPPRVAIEGPAGLAMTGPAETTSILGDAERYLSVPQASADPVLLGAGGKSHDRARRLISARLTDALREVGRKRIEEHAERLVAQVTDAGVTDAVRSLAVPLASWTLARVLGLDEDGEERLAVYAIAHLDGIPGGSGHQVMEALEAALQGTATAGSLLNGLQLSCAQAGLGEGAPLSLANIIVAGGLDTTISLLTSVTELAAQGGELGVDRAILHQPPLRWVLRSDATTGELVVAFLDAALRSGAPASLAFGAGVHRCVGEPLARLQALTLAGALARRTVTCIGAAPPISDGQVATRPFFPVSITR